MKILVTGGCGFIGHHFVEHLLKNTDFEIVLLERYSFAGSISRIVDIKCFSENKSRVKIVWHDLRSEVNEFTAKEIGEIEYIVHFAASTHVDRSIKNPRDFVLDNVLGTCNILEFARTLKKLKLFINFSTDEVFGPASNGYFHKEADPHLPSNPYASTKSGSTRLAYSYWVTYKLPVINTYTMNNFGERQNPEKFIPKTIRNIIQQKPMPIYATLDANGKVIETGMRVWIHCRNTSSALLFLIDHAMPGEDYNIIGKDEYEIGEVAEKISQIIGRPLIPEYVGFYGARPGHDRRYALDGSKMEKMGWKIPMNFDMCLEKTVKWTLDNQRWI